MRHGAIACVITALIAVGGLRAQSVAVAPPDTAPKCQPDFSARDTIRMVITASLPVDHSEPVPIQMLRRVIYEHYLQGYRNPPAVYWTDVWRKPTSLLPGGWLRSMHRFGEVRFTISANGQVSAFQLIPGTPQPRFDSALAAAAVRLDSARYPFTTSDHRDTLQMRILLDEEGKKGIMPVPIIVGYLITVPRSDAVLIRGGPPKYPGRQEADGQAGEVVVVFKVLRDGHADMNTIRVTSATRKEFVEAVLEVLPTYQFQPAMVSGCAQEDWVGLPFSFGAP